MGGALSDIRILDLTRFLPGPFCTMILGDLGASIIKVEQPEPESRFLPPSFLKVGVDDGLQRAHNCLGRNKRSIAINLKSKEGKDIYYKLVNNADVIVEEFRPGVTKRLNIDYDTIKTIQPEIIYCAISSYGQDGPYSQLPGFDPNYISVGGLLGLTGDKMGNHVLPGVAVGDMSAGMMGAIGILAALTERWRSGKGQFVDISATDAVAYLVGTRIGPQYFLEGIQPRRGSRLPHVYETKDGKYISFSFGTQVFWERLCQALGVEDYIEYYEDIQALGLEDSMPNPEDVRRRQDRVVSHLSQIFLTKTRDEWLKVLFEWNVCVSPVNEFDEVFKDPQVLFREMLLNVEDSRFGTVKQVGIPVKLRGTPGSVRSIAPARGEHTEEIMCEIGYAVHEIQQLRRDKIIS